MVPDFSKYADYVDMPENEFDAIGEYIPKEVCHYTKMSVALTKILPNKQILLGNLHETNDPLETQTRWHEWINHPRSPGDPIGLTRSEVSVRNIKVFSTCCHINPSWSSADLRSTSFEFGTSYSRMWAHYSERHTGVCIIFDGKELDNHMGAEVGDNSQVRHGFIKYNYGASTLPMQGRDMSEIWNNYKRNFLCKSPEWKTEHEFRWLVQTETDSKLLIPIDKAIKAVIVGKNFDKDCLPLLEKLCKELSISPMQIDWIDGVPFLFQIKK